MGRYSYSQPSLSDSHGSLGERYCEDFIIEDGIPRVCFCGRPVVIDTCRSAIDPGKRYFTCSQHDDGGSHVWKWWDEAVTEDLASLKNDFGEIALKVHFLTVGDSLEVAEDLKKANTEIAELKEFQKGNEVKIARLEKLAKDTRIEMQIVFVALVVFLAVFVSWFK